MFLARIAEIILRNYTVRRMFGNEIVSAVNQICRFASTNPHRTLPWLPYRHPTELQQDMNPVAKAARRTRMGVAGRGEQRASSFCNGWPCCFPFCLPETTLWQQQLQQMFLNSLIKTIYCTQPPRLLSDPFRRKWIICHKQSHSKTVQR